jgi:uncharacterized membrane protein YciS (DUF1049 family)
MSHALKKWSLLALGAAVLVLALQNSETVTVRFVVWELTMSRVLLIALLFGAGLLAGWILRAWGARKQG